MDLRVVVLLRRYDDTKRLRGQGGQGYYEKNKNAHFCFLSLFGGFSPGDPENRMRGAILRILVVGEPRGMTFKLFYAKLRKNLLSLLFLAPTIPK